MFRELFPGRTSLIPWFAYCEYNGRCRVRDFIDGLPQPRQGQLIGRMKSFADLGWSARANFIKQLQVECSHTIYEIKSHQERVLFVRCANAAVSIDGFTKKNDWSKKDQKTLDAAIVLVEAAIKVWKGENK